MARQLLRTRRYAAVLTVAVLCSPLLTVRPAGATQGDTITVGCSDSDTPGALDINTAMRGTDPTTASFTITTCSPFTDTQTQFIILVDTTGTGFADKWVLLGYDTAANALVGYVGQAGSFHLHTATVMPRTAPSSSITVSFPRSLINGSTTFDWAVLSAAGTSSAPIIDLAPDAPTVHLAVPTRIAGTDRIDTAVQASFFPDNGAKAVVLARSDDYPDALGGAPLAAAKKAPLLLTPPTALDPRTLAEIQRVLPSGGTVYLLGGLNALSADVDNAVKAAGYTTVRYSGPTRYDTSLAIVEQGLNDPATILLTTGTNFPDALSAGAAAANKQGGVLLTDGNQLPAQVQSYLSAHPSDSVYAVGGPAAAADPAATPVVGADRYQTSAKVATTFFSSPTSAGVASGLNFPDALAGGATMGEGSGPLLLTDPSVLSTPTHDYLVANKSTIGGTCFVFGGPAAVSDNVAVQIGQALLG